MKSGFDIQIVAITEFSIRHSRCLSCIFKRIFAGFHLLKFDRLRIRTLCGVVRSAESEIDFGRIALRFI